MSSAFAFFSICIFDRFLYLRLVDMEAMVIIITEDMVEDTEDTEAMVGTEDMVDTEMGTAAMADTVKDTAADMEGMAAMEATEVMEDIKDIKKMLS